MAQTLNPLYGESLKDSTFTRAVSLPHGVYLGMDPTLFGAGGAAGWTAQLAPNADGWSAWRTRGDTDRGKFIVQETAPVQVKIDAPDANPRIDLIIGIHRWAEGPINPVTMKPTGEFTNDQRATYAVVKGTPSSSPTDPVVADPYTPDGHRAVILARVHVPVSGSASIERYVSTDLRLDFMRQTTAEVELARGVYPTLKNRLDSINTSTQVQSLDFRGSTAVSGGMSQFAPATTKVYGSAISKRTSNTFGLLTPGLYEIMAFHKIEGQGDSCVGIAAYLVYNGGSPILIDYHYDNSTIEVSSNLYAQIYVDPSWTDPYVYFTRAGWPVGFMRGSIKYLGTPQTLQPLGIATGNIAVTESSGQAYPDDYTVGLQALNAVGATIWSVVTETGKIDGTTEPKAEIVSDNQLKITWASRPVSFPATYSVKLQVIDSASTPRVATKTITVTLSTASALAITNTDFAVTPSSYPYVVQFQPTATGGASPYTWEVAAGADTTLPSAAYSGSIVSGTVSANGTYKVRLRVTDGAATQAELVVNITSTRTVWGGGGGGGCVPEGTLFEVDGASLPVENIAVGMVARGYNDETFEPVMSRIAQVFKFEDRAMAVLVTEHGSLRCSRDHRPWRRESRKTRGTDPHWPPVEEMLPGDHTLWEVDGELVETLVLEVKLLDETATVYHVAMDAGHVYVAGSVPAHNLVSEAALDGGDIIK